MRSCARTTAGSGGSSGNLLQTTTREIGFDALAGVRLLEELPEIDDERIGLVGHSEGATAAAMAATESDEVAFVVLMAGPALRGDEILFSQARMLGEKMRTGDEAIEAHQAVQRAIFEALESEEDDALALTKIQEAIEAEAERLGAGESPEALARLKAQAAGVRPNRWFRAFLKTDPVEWLRRVEQPVLALFAENDMQVAPDLNLPPMRAALEGNDDATVETLDGLNHLFQTSESGMPQEYSSIEQTMAPRRWRASLSGSWSASFARGPPSNRPPPQSPDRCRRRSSRSTGRPLHTASKAGEAAFEHAPEEARKAAGIGLGRRIPVAHRPRLEEGRDHRADSVDRQRLACFRGGRFEPVRELCGDLVEPLVDFRPVAQFAQQRQAAGDGQRIA